MFHGIGGKVVLFTKYPYNLDTLSYYAKKTRAFNSSRTSYTFGTFETSITS